jgi:hypothetical protein
VALLPPFEGFDEFAHYSSLRQIAQTATIPIYGASYLDREVTNYLGPMPYSSGMAPFRALLGAKSYAEFYADPANLHRYSAAYSGATPLARFKQSQVPNWQAQHPPLYYIVMAPLVMATDHLAFLSQLLILRLVSYALAVIGVLFGLGAVGKGAVSAKAGVLGFFCYPLLCPEFFPEFARIGNDSLCLLLLGYLFYLIANQTNPAKFIDRPWSIGLLLGLGLLTKALFLPLTAALIVWLVLSRLSIGTGNLLARIRQMPDIAKILVLALSIGSWWYAYNFFVFGEVSGGDEAIRLSRAGGMIAGLQNNFSLWPVVRGFGTIPVTWVWTGAWSLARLPAYMQLPVVLLALWVVGESLVRVRRDSLATVNVLTVMMTGALCLGLMHRTLQGIAVGGSGNQGGWYLHILTPWVAVALGGGIGGILQRSTARRIFGALAGYAAVFHLMALWAEASLFSGCAVKGPDKLFQFSSSAYCLDQASLVFEKLRVIAWPGVALCGFGAALGCAVWAAYAARDYLARGVVAPSWNA